MPNIEWIDERHATGELADFYREWFERNPERTEIPGIMKCFSQRPDFLRDVMLSSYRVHFSDGHLDRRTKEMIATYVSALNKCRY
ncbi:MAG: carboxymuconolactone decarboxylase family protein [Planctomycetales bacterium]|nr:carboxymuconolactone decarboxylase family protein [Planctomycetales bacterium]